jgi:hypothetical protein
MTLRHPRRTLDVMRLSQSDGVKQAFVTLSVAYLLGLIAALIPYKSSDFDNFLSILMLMIGLVCVAHSVCFTLIAIESKGLQFIGKSRGFRIDSKLAWAIVGHGSVGWIIIGFGLSIALSAFLYYPSRDASVTNWIESSRELNRIAIIILLTSMILGFFFFECFAYLGLRRCKYANRVKPECASDE